MAARMVKTIGTHSGTFHCDEALACFLLRSLDTFKGATITRSRDPSVLEKLDCLVDVGSEYDPARLRFDHHQRSFAETFSPQYDVRLSSAGLVYKHYGREVVANLTALPAGDQLEAVYEHVYDGFVLALDAIDNGVSQYPATMEPRYRSSTDLGARVSRLNPRWNEKLTGEELMARFERAIAITGDDFTDAVRGAALSWLPAREVVRAALARRFEDCPTGEFFVLSEFAPWKGTFFDEEKAEPAEVAGTARSLARCKFAIYPSEDGGWRYQAVPVNPASFAQRQQFPSAWFGLRDTELDAATGVEAGAKFVHHSGFTGGHATQTGAIAMVQRALELASEAAQAKNAAEAQE
jgi:uncharacterized UPF0160 family protein